MNGLLPKLDIDGSRDKPLYRQIADALSARIQSGDLPAGTRLPPTRRLAESLSTHRNTVVRAFELLVDKGYVTSEVGRGTFVAAQGTAPAPRHAPQPAADGSSGKPWARLLSRAATSEPWARLERVTRGVQVPADVINLSRMQPSPALLPEQQLRACLDAVTRTRPGDALGYAPRQGVARLREQISRDLATQGIDASPEAIIITSGSQQALDVVARLLVNPGDLVLTEARTYSGALNIFEVLGAELMGIDCDADGPIVPTSPALTSRAKSLYVIPNSRNPTGTTMSLERRRELLAWSARAGVPIIEDDYGADLNLDGDPTPQALRSLDSDVFYLGTFSKKLIPALRVGFVVSPAGLAKTLVGLKHAMDLGTSALLQHALAEFLERGYLREHLQRTLPIYRARRDALAEALTAYMPQGVAWNAPRRGVVQWLTLPEGLDGQTIYDDARRAGVLVSPSTLYDASDRQSNGLRLAFCYEPEERLVEGAKRLGEVITRALSRRPSRSTTRTEAIMDWV